MNRGGPLQRRTPMRRAATGRSRATTRSDTKPRRRRPDDDPVDIPAEVRAAVLARDEWRCVPCGHYLGDGSRPYSVQHRRARKMGGRRIGAHTMPNLITVCGTGTTWCHGWIEASPAEADEVGWSCPEGVDPGVWPVLRMVVTPLRRVFVWQQPGDGWVDAVPMVGQTRP